jgi:hypothetical protein
MGLVHPESFTNSHFHFFVVLLLSAGMSLQSDGTEKQYLAVSCSSAGQYREAVQAVPRIMQQCRPDCLTLADGTERFSPDVGDWLHNVPEE